jgi:hypothetical protein
LPAPGISGRRSLSTSSRSIAASIPTRTDLWTWLFLGALVIFIFTGIPSSVAGPFLSNLGEPVINGASLATALNLGDNGDSCVHQGTVSPNRFR